VPFGQIFEDWKDGMLEYWNDGKVPSGKITKYEQTTNPKLQNTNKEARFARFV
jgi:hypothetical protein